jgi:hypothetical protein
MSIILTKMLPLIRQWEAERLDVNEILMSRYGAWDLGISHTASSKSILSPENKKLAMQSYGNTVKIPVFEGEGISIGNSVSCTITDFENTTNLIALSFTAIQWQFAMYWKQYAAGTQPINYIGADSDFDFKVKEVNLQLMAQQDTAVRNAIDLAANTYWPSNIATSYYPVVANALQITQADKDDCFNQLAAIMNELDFYETMDILGSTKLGTLKTRLESQGTGNATNQMFQFKLGAFIFTSSNRVTSAAGVSMTGYAIRQGSIALFNANRPECIGEAVTIGPGEYPAKQWDHMEWPWLKMDVGSFLTNDCAANNGGFLTNNQSLRTGYSWDTSFGILLPPPNNLHGQTPIIKFEITTN